MSHRSRRSLGAVLLLATAALVAAAPSHAGPKPKHHVRPHLDVNATASARAELAKRADALAERPAAAVSALRRSLGSGAVVDIDPLTQTPRAVAKLDGYLTAASADRPEAIARDYLRANRAVFRLDDASLKLTKTYTDTAGIHHVRFAQTVSGVPVLNGGVRVNIAPNSRIVNVVGSPATILSGTSMTPAIAAEAALATALRSVDGAVVPWSAKRSSDGRRTTEFSSGDRAALGLFATTEGLRLGWETFYTAGAQGLYRAVVDAATGQLLYRVSLTADSNGRAFENYPGAPTGGTQTTFDLTGNGWLPVGSKYLSGPNTHVFLDVDDSNVAEQSEEINPSAVNRGERHWLWGLQRFFPDVAGCDDFICTWDSEHPGSWSKNANQSGTQLFVLVNKFHDHLEAAPIGFTNAAGNFEGDDPVLGHALDGATTDHNLPDANHIDNANMATPPDGQSPVMQMFLWHQPGAGEGDPFIAADGSNDAGIVYHEYTHGLSNRLVVDSLGNSTLNSLQAGAMGEAWSDFYAYDFLSNEGFQQDDPDVGDVRVGHYVGAGQDLIRFEPIDCRVDDTAANGCPGGAATGEGGFTYGDLGAVLGFPEVHADGEIWAQTLWQIRDAVGSTVTQSLVTRAMELSPDDPSFLDMRNAILQADTVLNSGSNHDDLWAVFAERGMGFFAGAFDGNDTHPVESFALPPAPGGPTGSLSGTVTDVDTGEPLESGTVAFGGHDSALNAGEMLFDSTDASGGYSISGIPVGTYPKVNAFVPGWDRVEKTVTIAAGANSEDYEVRRDWASGLAGADIVSFTGPDLSVFFCGPDKLIDQTGIGWLSTSEPGGGTFVPKQIVIELPAAVDVTQFGIDPTNPCGVGGSGSTAGFRVETSQDGTTWTTAAEGTFTVANRNQLNAVIPTAGADDVRFVRYTMLSAQVPGGAAGCPGPFAGCTFMGTTELEVYGDEVTP